MPRTRKAVFVAAAVAALAGGGAGVAQAVGGDDEKQDPVLTGPDVDRARAAALRIVGSGSAGSVERDDEKGATWEVEVKKPDGSTVDVRLDSSFTKVAVDADTESGAKDAEE